MKMKVYSIGREEGCDIVINDNSDVISRRHAILNVMSSGKMTITDQSHNGTYVNGIRISPNVPVPVTRKDNISFAHISRLDWNMSPKPTGITQYVIYGIIALAVVVGVAIAYSLLSGNKSNPVTDGGSSSPLTEAIDSCTICKKPIIDCEFKGKHPDSQQKVDTCKICQKPTADCQYKGNHPAPAHDKKKPGKKIEPVVKKCATCGKPVSECKYKGKHPDKKDKDVTRGDR